jgi:histone H3/H4
MVHSSNATVKRMTREEIEQKMDELARKYVETHNQKIIDELCELARELMEMEKLEKQ